MRAISIVNFLNAASGPQSLSEISDKMGLSTTIVHRLLTTLKLEGLVFQDPRTKHYSLGSVFVDYANKILTEMPIAPVVEPWLSDLRRETGETVGFYMPMGQSRICVLEYESQQEIRRSVGIGKRMPIHLGASGRAIMAFQPDELQSRVVDSLPLEEQDWVRSALTETRTNGYAVNEEEITSNVAAISAPVLDRKKRVIGSLSISGPMFRWNRQVMQGHVSSLLKAAEEIGNSL